MLVSRGGVPSTSSLSQSGTNWTFQLSPEPVTVDEQQQFQSDLSRLGVDDAIWGVFNAVLETGTPDSRPRVVRMSEAGKLAGLALIYECRKSGECFFDPPYSRLMDFPGTPMFVWLRYGITVDHFANPGFVADGIDRHQFIAHCVRFLLGTYLYGSVVEYRDSPALPGAVKFPFVDGGVVELDGLSTIGDYLGRGKNLSRKLKKFRNKGGEIRVIKGAMPDELRSAALTAFDTLNITVRTPFQDNYLNMAGSGMSHDALNKVHFVALLDGVYAGHQSFCHTGNVLVCQAGAFDRSRNSTYHAYENIIVESVDYAMRRGLERIDYGPVINETKAKMMTGFIAFENRTYARYRPIAAALPQVLKRSKLAPERLARWCDLGDRAQPSFV